MNDCMVLSYFLLFVCVIHLGYSSSIIHLNELENIPNIILKDDLTVFCYKGLVPRAFRMWHIAFLQIKEGKNVKFYNGPNATTVFKKHNDDDTFFGSISSFLASSLLTSGSSQNRNFNAPIPTFQYSCIGVVSEEAYTAQLLIKIEPLYVVLTLLGIALFVSAKKCSRNLAFYYASGISVSLLASLMVLVLIIHRFLPMRRGLYAFLAIGGSLSLVLFQRISSHIGWLMAEYRAYVISYFGTITTVSAAFIYWYGPPVDSPRTVQLVQWSLQAMTLLCIYCAIQIQTCAVAVITSLIVSYLISGFSIMPTVYRLRNRFFYRMFPPKRRYLSEEEYNLETTETTQRALEDLRRFCQSPDCNAWRVISRLKSPGRMASFVGDGTHITRGELIEYDQTTSSFEEDEMEDVVYDRNIHEPLQSTPVLTRVRGRTNRLNPATINNGRLPHQSMLSTSMDVDVSSVDDDLISDDSS